VIGMKQFGEPSNCSCGRGILSPPRPKPQEEAPSKAPQEVVAWKSALYSYWQQRVADFDQFAAIPAKLFAQQDDRAQARMDSKNDPTAHTNIIAQPEGR